MHVWQLTRSCLLAALPALAVVLLTAGACAGGDNHGAQSLKRISTHQPPAVSTPDVQMVAIPAVADVGPDWAVVERYRDPVESAGELIQDLQDAPNEEEWQRRRDAWQARTDIVPAVAAATAIVNAGSAHERFVEAAEFLVYQTHATRNANRHRELGAMALLEHAPDYDQWPSLLAAIAAQRGPHPLVDAFMERAATTARPFLRATARYHVATRLMHSWNELHAAPEERAARRRRAVDVATGLSTGMDHEAGPPVLHTSDGLPNPRSFAQAESDLLQSIRHATVGGTLREMVGRRLGGVEERLSNLRGRVVLIDFWATWCGPCISELPALRRLVADLPADRFTLLAISVDEDVETVKAFQETEAMPWTNWHAGLADDLFLHWDLRGLPTYVLADEHGMILARTHDMDEQLEALIRSTVKRTGAGTRAQRRTSVRTAGHWQYQ